LQSKDSEPVCRWLSDWVERGKSGQHRVSYFLMGSCSWGQSLR